MHRLGLVKPTPSGTLNPMAYVWSISAPEPSHQATGEILRTHDTNRAMASMARQVESKALKLSAGARARLTERHISSLENQADPDTEKLWAEEAERRVDELRSGRVKSRSAEGVFRKARSALR